MFKLRCIACILAFIFFGSCNNEENKSAGNEAIGSIFPKDTLRKVANEDNGVFIFKEYDDNGDYMLLIAERGDSLVSFINDKVEERNLLRGDTINVVWNKDSIYMVGDGDRSELANWIVSVRKIKDGKVSLFRKKYPKPVKYYWGKEYNFSKDFLNKMYKVVEYYLANSDRDLVKLNIDAQSQLTYSVEEQERDGKRYIALGLASDFENHVSIIQWLYYDPLTEVLYEYDLPNDKLIEFK